MKTFIRRSLLVTFMLGTLISYATENNETKVKVELTNVKEGQNWSIKNSRGNVIHKEEIKRNGSFTRDFNFTSLKNGYYTIEVNKDFQIDIVPFTIVSGKVTFYKNAEKTIFKPIFRAEENKIMISKLDFESSSLRVTIYFEGAVIFKDVIQAKEEKLKRIYKLREDKKGDYKVVMKANDRTYINEFSL
ncbi:MAG: hypothetical protein JXR05_01690 [Flavobacteriaceae bacterium]